jgi:hypothetical protein
LGIIGRSIEARETVEKEKTYAKRVSKQKNYFDTDEFTPKMNTSSTNPTEYLQQAEIATLIENC